MILTNMNNGLIDQGKAPSNLHNTWPVNRFKGRSLCDKTGKRLQIMNHSVNVANRFSMLRSTVSSARQSMLSSSRSNRLNWVSE